MQYLKNEGVGYFISENSDSPAINQIEAALRHYITQNLTRPALPPVAKISSDVERYAGWYQPDSPRTQMTAHQEILFSNIRVRFENNRMYTKGWLQLMDEYEFEPVTPTQFRILPMKVDKQAPPPIVTDVLLPITDEGTFLQGYTGQRTLKHIPTWLFFVKAGVIVWFFLAVLSTLLYTPCWMIAGIFKRFRKPADRGLRVWPSLSAIAFISIQLLNAMAGADPIARLGNLTLWSGGLFVATIAFALAVLTGLIVWWRSDQSTTRGIVRWYSLSVLLPMLFAVLYFAYWGLIGIRTWA
jgi:hypothetical protein